MVVHRRIQRGFVLVLVLMVLAISASVLAIAARRSGGRALAAGRALADLQLRWGSQSCRRTCLPQAERLLRQARSPDKAPVATVRRTIKLGGIEFDLIVADEQAKADVNAVAHRQKMAGVETLLRALQTGRRVLPVRLRPAPPPAHVIAAVPVQLASYDQLYSIEHPSVLIEAGEVAPAIQRVTCWAGGKLNLSRAEPIVIEQALAGLLTRTQVARLEALRRAKPGAPLEQMVREMELTREQAQALAPWVTATSTCHSLWVIASDGRRRFYQLDVDQAGDAQNDSQHWSFRW